MPVKHLMLEHLGEGSLLLPSLVNAGLTANDRVKYLLSLLQAAVRHADAPGGEVPLLRRERQAAGVADATLDQVPGECERAGAAGYRLPRAGEIEALALEAVEAMLAPVTAAGLPELPAESYARRLAALRGVLGPSQPASLTPERLERLTSGLRAGGDSLHLLVMDLHGALNTLQQRIATEEVDGALTYGLDGWGRGRVAAFMGGLNRTSPLRFDHPGLGTTATMAGERLVIQNDIGTSDVHVLVVHVRELEATLTYSDLHPERLAFFRGLFEDWPLRWESTLRGRAQGATEGDYELATGTYQAPDPAALDRYLAHLGSRLVYLIDWNKARKRLRAFIGNRRAIAVLAWAARHDHGHMAFLKLGGDRLLYEVFETTRLPIRPGEELDAVLGAGPAEAFLRATLALCSEGLRRDRSEFLLRDELRVELAREIASSRGSALSLLQEHATLVVELAGGWRDALARLGIGDRAFAGRHATRARTWEHAADDLVNQARQLALRWHDASAVLELLLQADDVADDLEEAAFVLALPAEVTIPAEVGTPLAALAACVVRAAEEYARAVAAAGAVPQGSREDYADFLEAVDGVMAAEHQADEAHRAARAALLLHVSDARAMQFLAELARLVEASADGLMRSALALRTHLLATLGRR